MVSVFDAAAYLMEKAGGTIEQMQLHKLLYYGQGYALGNGRAPLFHERIEAWVNGPVVPALWQQLHYRFRVNHLDAAKAANLSADDRKLLDAIWLVFGKYDGATLSQFTHEEPPWKDARRGIPDWQRSNQEITVDALGTYFSERVHAAGAGAKEAAAAG
jgi:uncharacterized phage-associated protein